MALATVTQVGPLILMRPGTDGDSSDMPKIARASRRIQLIEIYNGDTEAPIVVTAAFGINADGSGKEPISWTVVPDSEDVAYLQVPYPCGLPFNDFIVTAMPAGTELRLMVC